MTSKHSYFNAKTWGAFSMTNRGLIAVPLPSAWMDGIILCVVSLVGHIGPV